MKKKRIRVPLLSEDTLTLKPALHFFDDLRAGVLTYISERYRGAFQIEESETLSGYVTVAHDALCFFVRLLLNDLFGTPEEDRFKRAASHVDGAMSILTGIAANKSMASGMPIDIKNLVDLK